MARIPKELIVDKVTSWTPPKENDARILTMPNIPHPLHGKGMQPRTILGATKWNKARVECYERANYCCEACGYKPEKGKLHAHELFEYDYEAGTGKFIRLVALCYSCHVLFIHSGRALTLYKKRSPIMSRDSILYGAEHGFKLISEYNKAHPGEEVYPFAAMAEYLSESTLKEDMEKLIEKYDMKFYGIAKTDVAFNEWKMIWRGKVYKTPYSSVEDWEKAMDEQNKEQKTKLKETSERLSGGVFDEIDNIINESLSSQNKGEDSLSRPTPPAEPSLAEKILANKEK